MEMKKTGLWTLACMVLAVGAFAQQPHFDGLSPEQEARNARLQSIEADRAGTAEALVSRWQGANANLGSGWEAELRQVAGKASADKLLAASEASTYRGVVNALLNGGREVAAPGEKVLGDEASDLVYFPVTPCRIVDTRHATGIYAGQIVAGTPRAFAHNQNLAAQGNTAGATDCGIPTDPAAIAVTVTTVSPLAAGNLIGYQTGLATPAATSINNYAVVPGLAIANTTIIPTGQILGNDFVIAVNGGSVHVVIDIVGYFWKPTFPTAGQAFAHIYGSLQPARTKGFSSYTNPGTGIYCLVPSAGVNLLIAPPSVTVDYSGSIATTVAQWRNSGIGCNTGELAVYLWNSSTGAAVGGAFTVFVP